MIILKFKILLLLSYILLIAYCLSAIDMDTSFIPAGSPPVSVKTTSSLGESVERNESGIL